MSRLFFALWPPSDVRRQITEVAELQAVYGNRVTPQRLHLTLRFLGEVVPENLPPLRRAVSKICVPEFVMALSELGYFRTARIAWLGPPQPPGALSQLVEEINQAAGQAGLRREPHVFRPHVSLARNAQPPGMQRLPRPIVWQVSEFSLCDSLLTEHGPVYHNAGCWPLARGVGM